MGKIVEWILQYWLQVAFGVLCTVLSFSGRWLVKKFKNQAKIETAMQEAALALLDHSMGKLFQECKEKGNATREEARRYERMYVAYHNLGGNGAVTNERNQFNKIEIVADD